MSEPTKIHGIVLPVEVHPAANIFPPMSEEEFAGLVDDIRQNGQKEYCVFYENKLLDGRNRYAACVKLGIEPLESEIDEPTDPVLYVLSKNLHRRHLTESQRAMVAAKIANMEVGKPPSNSANLQNYNSAPQVSTAQAADALKVSERSVASAKKVQSQGTEKLNAAVESGQVSVSAAARATELPHQQQDAIAEGKLKPPAAKKGGGTLRQPAMSQPGPQLHVHQADDLPTAVGVSSRQSQQSRDEQLIKDVGRLARKINQRASDLGLRGDADYAACIDLLDTLLDRIQHWCDCTG